MEGDTLSGCVPKLLASIQPHVLLYETFAHFTPDIYIFIFIGYNSILFYSENDTTTICGRSNFRLVTMNKSKPLC